MVWDSTKLTSKRPNEDYVHFRGVCCVSMLDWGRVRLMTSSIDLGGFTVYVQEVCCMDLCV